MRHAEKFRRGLFLVWQTVKEERAPSGLAGRAGVRRAWQKQEESEDAPKLGLLEDKEQLGRGNHQWQYQSYGLEQSHGKPEGRKWDIGA